MPYRGYIKDGVVTPHEAFPWPEGTEVAVDLPMPLDGKTTGDQSRTLYDRLKPLIGIAKGLPTDLAENHDHYIHGTPKK